MKLGKQQRETLRMMFGGKCAYCGCELGSKWHADHVEAVQRDWDYVPHPKMPGYAIAKQNGKLLRPENDHVANLYPACVKCNILKSNGNIENFRSALTYFATSIPTIQTYSHVHHLMRFGKLSIDITPVIFWFETYLAQQNALQSPQGD